MLLLIDGLQYANWSPKNFRQMRKGDVHGVHVTIAYHENFRETIANTAFGGALVSFAAHLLRGGL